MNKQLAEFVGTFALVFFGCGAAVVGGMGSGPTAVNLLGISSAFGFAIVAMAYGIGPISGCHVNPAVSFGVFVAGAQDVKRETLSAFRSNAWELFQLIDEARHGFGELGHFNSGLSVSSAENTPRCQIAQITKCFNVPNFSIAFWQRVLQIIGMLATCGDGDGHLPGDSL